MNTWFKLVVIALTLIVCSCHKLHWQRNKVRVRQPAKVPSIQVSINDKAPYLFWENFDADLKKICEREFVRMGYCLTKKDTADFLATVNIDIDSFATKGYYVIGTGGPSFFWKSYRKNRVYALLFDYKIVNVRHKTTKWEEKNDIYFFDDVGRDSRRCINMIKYTIRYGK